MDVAHRQAIEIVDWSFVNKSTTETKPMPIISIADFIELLPDLLSPPPPPSWPPSPPRKKKEQLTQSQTRTAAAPTAELTKRRSASVSGTTPLIGPRGGVGFPPHSTPSPVWYRKWFKAFPWRRQNECSAADWCTLTSCLLLGTSLVVGHFVR